MLRDAIWYPRQGPGWLWTLATGGVLTLLGAVLFVPLIPVQGYLLRVLAETGDGRPYPPRFTDWPDLFVDGARAVAVQIGYALVPVWLVVAGLSVAGYGAFSGLAGTTAGTTVELFGQALVVAGTVGLVAAAYLAPAALTRLATTDSLRAAFDLRAVASAGRRPLYVVAVVEGYAALLFIGAVGAVSSLILVGGFVVFYGQVTAYRLFARGYTGAVTGTDPGS